MHKLKNRNNVTFIVLLILLGNSLKVRVISVHFNRNHFRFYLFMFKRYSVTVDIINFENENTKKFTVGAS